MGLNIILANPRGFCAGVNMAIDVVDEILRVKGAPLYVYHEIVHNRHVVDGFKARGVTFVNDVSEVPVGSTIVYSAHGISPAVRNAARIRGLKEIDATCPLVTKVHMEVIRYAKQGYQIVFIGHRNHDEAVGTVGEAPESIVVVESVEDVEKLNVANPNKLAFVTQTTLSVSDAEKIIGALKRKYPQIKSPPKDDICYATTNRQNAVSLYAPDADIVLVIGSKNSSNSQRLVDRAKEAGKPAYLIDDQSELKPEWFQNVNAVLITAGASAPEHLVNDLIDRLRRDYDGAVEVRTLVDEDVSFAPPASLKSLVVLN
jgi:4-hydroxy-3-methylbut-2-en-1-yl diphosphate reductase